MKTVDLKKALEDIEPSTKAGKIRQLMPVIEQKMAAGVRRGEILATLKKHGLDISENTLKSYLYRFKAEKAASPDQVAKQPGQVSAAVDSVVDAGSPPSSTTGEQVAGAGVSETALELLMKPDPVQQAQQMEKYSQVAKSNRREKK